MLTAGTQFKDYEVWGRIGGGGMSDVWLARHTTLAVPVIVKTLRSDLKGNSDEHFARLANEARLMARVQSHRVVKAIDFGLADNTPYLVQEYIDGIDVNELDKLRRSALGLGLPLWFVCEIVAEVAQGLSAAHYNGVIHRDVKPSNIFCSPSMGTKLGDFGIAVTRGTGPNDIGGTLTFMAPEALRGDPIDRKADIFALGATAYDLRYGRSPFCDVEAAHRATNTVLPDFPPAGSAEEAFFQYLVSKMLSPVTSERFNDLNEPRRGFSTLAAMTRASASVLKVNQDSLLINGTKITCEQGDIAQISVDGIVSSASPSLVVGTSVGEALSYAAGPDFVEEAMATGSHPLGSCVVTNPGKLPCRKVIHAVSAWNEVSCIARAVQRALLLAEQEGLHSLAIPALGTGAAKVSIEASAFAQAQALMWHLRLGGTRLREIRFILASEEKLKRFRDVLDCVFFDSNNPAREEVGRNSDGKHDVAHSATELVKLTYL